MDNLKALFSDFNLLEKLPDLGDILTHLGTALRISVMAAPVLLLVLGLIYLLLPARQANYRLGYRCFWAMSGPEVWLFTQRLAGIVWGSLGLILTVVMAILSNRMKELAPDAMTWYAVRCLLWELGLVVVSMLAINITVMALFDRKGSRRTPKA